jgi:hypothetical protein
MTTDTETGVMRARPLLLDRQLPRFDARSFTAVVVDAEPEQTYREVRSLDPDQVARSVPFMRLMGQARALPTRVGAGRHHAAQPAADALRAQQYQEAFQPIGEEPGVEFLVGMIGKFMSATELEFRRFDPTEFAGFGEPGYGKVAVSFLVLPYGDGRSLLCTETRTATTDPASAKRFRRYWTVIGPFARYIMRRWVLLAKSNAERAT